MTDVARILCIGQDWHFHFIGAVIEIAPNELSK